MNETFIRFLLEGIETYNENPETEQLAELFLGLILAFNLQYCNHQKGKAQFDSSKHKFNAENLIMKCLCERENTKFFTEKLLLLFNREGKCTKYSLFFI